MTSEIRTAARFLRREIPSVILVLLSWVALSGIGLILDILLLNWPSNSQGKPLPRLTEWVLHHLAGYRGLTVDILNCFWVGLVFLFTCNALFSRQHADFQRRFLYSFLILWSFAVTFVLFVVLALAEAFNSTLAKWPPDSFYSVDLVRMIHRLMVFAVVALLIGVPVARRVARWKREREEEERNQASDPVADSINQMKTYLDRHPGNERVRERLKALENGQKGID